MTFDPSLYPDNWEEISHRIRFDRAKGRCEWCGAPNGVLIARSDIDPSKYLWIDEEDFVYHWPDGEEIRSSEIPEEYEGNWTRVWLTVHHVGVDKPDGTPGDREDKMDCREANLAALCQRCHLLADIDLHVAKRLQTHWRKKHEAAQSAGQLVLFGDLRS